MAKHAGPSLPLDGGVARAKFEREVQLYRQAEAAYRAQGCWLLSATFPEALFAFVQPQLRPQPVLFGVNFDFTNYDLWPPSVRFVDPFTGAPLPKKALEGFMNRAIFPDLPEQVRGMPGLVIQPTPRPLLQAIKDDEIPFLCLPGVREYHDHPAHSGDSWFLHRRREGTLAHLLSVIVHYGVAPVKSFHMGLNISINGYKFDLVQ